MTNMPASMLAPIDLPNVPSNGPNGDFRCGLAAAFNIVRIDLSIGTSSGEIAATLFRFVPVSTTK